MEITITAQKGNQDVQAYINLKVRVLYDIGLTNANLVRTYLRSEIKYTPVKVKREIMLDRICSTLIDQFYKGDLTFVDKKETAYDFYNKVLAIYPDASTLYEDTIIAIVGKYGLQLMKESNLVECCAYINKRRLYAII